MIDVSDSEIAKRIEIANRFKGSSGRPVIVFPEVFGDKVDYATGKPVTNAQRNARACDSDFDVSTLRTLAMMQSRKRENGGIIGITVHQRERGMPPRYQVVIKARAYSYDCAVAAANKRNSEMEKMYPGRNEAKCDMVAVWKRWGCSCGRHERGMR